MMYDILLMHFLCDLNPFIHIFHYIKYIYIYIYIFIFITFITFIYIHTDQVKCRKIT